MTSRERVCALKKMGITMILPPTVIFGRDPPPDLISASFGPATRIIGAMNYLLNALFSRPANAERGRRARLPIGAGPLDTLSVLPL